MTIEFRKTGEKRRKRERSGQGAQTCKQTESERESTGRLGQSKGDDSEVNAVSSKKRGDTISEEGRTHTNTNTDSNRKNCWLTNNPADNQLH